ncbi:enhancer of mRNA-decapping protein 4 [Mixophyes fleayi]|uniref:enhancer of mRNA-decapping protein 4 n=1 Tax=Mixophyes fleayi TaxID=3061075 RepID=UPI003F4DE9F1
MSEAVEGSMSSVSKIDMDATQHLRDILKLDRPGDPVNESQQKSCSFNGDLNGFLAPDTAASGDTANVDAILLDSSFRNSGMVPYSERQVICLSGGDSSSCIEITGKDVEIVASNDSSICSKARGSNKVKIQPVAKYDWEQKYYNGNLIAVSNAYLAYATRGSNGSAMIRVLSVTTAERILLKGITGSVSDLAFAHLNSNQLACLDEAGSLFVWRLTMENGKILDEIIVHIRSPDHSQLNSHRRIIWCPYVPEENEDNSSEDASQTVALLHEDRVSFHFDLLAAETKFSLTTVNKMTSSKQNTIRAYQGGGTVAGGLAVLVTVVHSVVGSLLDEEGETKESGSEPCVGGLVREDGAGSPKVSRSQTASAIVRAEWSLMWCQTRIRNGNPQRLFFIEMLRSCILFRCLHEWKPHNGRPVSCLLFCDNHKKQDPEVPFWRFLITGADQNRQLKMWCTVSWTCLQTIRFSPDPFSSSVLPGIKASLDLSAEFLILTDVQRKVFYVMELLQNQDDGRAAFTSISEFLLTHPVLSFGVQDVIRCRLQHTELLPSEVENVNITAEDTLESDEADTAAGVLIKLFCVHTKALQDVQIRFKPHQNPESTVLLTSKATHEDLETSTRLPVCGTWESELGIQLANTQWSQTLSDTATPDQVIDIGPEKLPAAESLDGSQSDLLRATTDFLLLPTDSKPKLMTPDAFMMPSGSVQQIASSPGTSLSSITTATPLSNASISDASVSRTPDEMTSSKKLQLENSITLSSSINSGSFHASSRTPTVLIPGLSEKLTPKPVVQVTPSSLSLELQSLEPLVAPQASPTRERSPDVISSASTAMSQDIPEIASETLQRNYPATISLGLAPEGSDTTDHVPSMSSAASALHLLSTRNRNTSEYGLRSLEIGSSGADNELISAQSLDSANPQDKVEEVMSQPWPSAPDITRETRNNLIESDHDDEVASLANAMSSFGGKGQSPRLLVKDWKTQVSPHSSPKPYRKSMKDDPDVPQSPKIPDLKASFEQHGELMALLYSQQKELSELRQNQLELMQRLTDHLDAAQSSIMGHVERVIDTQQEQEQRRLDRILSDGQQRNTGMQEYLSQQLSHSLSGSLFNRLDKTIREEIKKTVPQCITKSLEPVTGHLSSTITAKLTSVEGTLKENVAKMIKSKNITDAIGRAVADALHLTIHTAYREAFQSIVLPAFEKGCQSMFQQINSSFKQGTQEYMQQLETHLKNRKSHEQEIREPLLTKLQQLIDSLQTTSDQLSSNLTGNVRSEVQHQLHVAVGNMQDSILTQVQRIIKEEVSSAMREQQAAVTSSIMHAMRSAAGTPIPSSHLDYQSQQAHILQLLQQGHLNQAFQQALTASDLNLILYVCETVDSQQVFGQHPCPLTQPVLLSLIQQLSFDLCTRTELKLNYLEEAVMHLDQSDPVTRDHMGTIMNQVRQKLFQFLQVETHSPLQKPARRLMIMLQGLVTPTMT